jgi:arylsulfatase A-like enzyme
LFADWTFEKPPSFNEDDVSDKPTYIRRRDKVSESEVIDRARAQLESLQAVDEAVGAIVQSLGEAGREDTLFIYTADNGLHWGEHRWTGKNVPYEEAIRVPLVITGASFAEDEADGRLALNLDLSATVGAVLGISTPGSEGVDLLSQTREVFGLEHWREITGRKAPSYCGARDSHRVFARYAGGFEEYYNLNRDTYQLSNRADAPQASARVREMRRLAKQICDPPPPGFSW